MTDSNDLDFAPFKIIAPTKKSNCSSSSNPTPKINHVKPSSASLAAFLHQKCGHINHQSLQKLADTGIIKGLPKKIPQLHAKCPLCTVTKGTAMPQNPSDATKPPVGSRFYTDFAFFNVKSVRGFTCALLFVDSTSCHPFGFPSRSKQPPIDALRWIV